MENYPSNSNASKKVNAELVPEKKVEKVVTGQVKRRRKNEFRKFADIFLPEDTSSVKSYILQDVIIPKVKDMLHDIGAEAWDSFWGISGRSHGTTTASKVSYQRYYDKHNGPNRPTSVSSNRPGYSFDDPVFESRGEAEEVLTRMDELLSTYGVVSIADLYDLAGLTCPYTANNYGWTDIHTAQIVRIRDGYVINMPRVMPLD